MSVLIDTNPFPECFSSFPVRVHKDEPQIAASSNAALEMFKRLVPEKDSRTHAAGPYGDLIAICFPEGDTEKEKLIAEILGAIWMYDGYSSTHNPNDIVEALPHDEAALEHCTAVKQMFSSGNKEANDITPSKKTLMTSIFHGIAARVTVLDAENAPWFMGTLCQHFTEYDRGDKAYDNIEDYVTFRILNAGSGLMSSCLQWCLSIKLSEEETERCKEFCVASGRVLALTNDYFSWGMEKQEATDRIRNAIPLIRMQYSVSEKEARIFLKGMIVDAEQTTWKLGLDLKKSGSETIKKYVDSIFLALGELGAIKWQYGGWSEGAGLE